MGVTLNLTDDEADALLRRIGFLVDDAKRSDTDAAEPLDNIHGKLLAASNYDSEGES